MASGTIRLDDDLPLLPEDLLLERDRGRVLFIAGAGVSRAAPSNLPDFQGLVADVYSELDARTGSALKRYIADQDKAAGVGKRFTPNWKTYTNGLDEFQTAETRRFIRGEYDVVFGMLERRLASKDEPTESVRKCVQKILSVTGTPNELHRALLTISTRFGTPFLATTNFDLLFEESAKRKKIKCKHHVLGAMPRASRRPECNGIFHIHGSLKTRAAESSLILTEQDFGDVYLRRGITSSFIYDAARIFSIVLVGYSLSDAPMRYLLNAIAGDEAHFTDIKPRYALIPLTSNDQSGEADWTLRGINPIPYDFTDDHSNLQRLLNAWAASVPTPEDDKWGRKRTLEITNQPVDRSNPEHLALFDYLIRRALPSTRYKFAVDLAKNGRDPSWLSRLNTVTRETVR